MRGGNRFGARSAMPKVLMKLSKTVKNHEKTGGLSLSKKKLALYNLQKRCIIKVWKI